LGQVSTLLNAIKWQNIGKSISKVTWSDIDSE